MQPFEGNFFKTFWRSMPRDPPSMQEPPALEAATLGLYSQLACYSKTACLLLKNILTGLGSNGLLVTRLEEYNIHVHAYN